MSAFAATPGIFDVRVLRDALGRFATGVTIITSRDERGEPIGVTANSFSSVSLDPPLVLWSLNRRALSLAAFRHHGAFAINVLSHGQKELSNRFAVAGADKWTNVAFECWETGCPILTGSLSSFECRTDAVHDGGDHVIFVGQVLRLVIDDADWPLLYWRGAYRRLDPDRPDGSPPPGAALALDGLEPWILA